MVFFFVVGSLLVAFALTVALETLLKPAETRRAAFRRVAAYAELDDAPQPVQVERPRLGEIVVPALSKVAMRLTPRGQVEELELRLEAAGFAGRLDAQGFLALKTVLAGIGVIVGFVAAGPSVGGFLLALVLAATSLFAPDLLLRRAARVRANRLTLHLPQVIDQIAISLEAGLAFDAAVAYFVRK